jgi:Peptidase family M28/PA domain
MNRSLLWPVIGIALATTLVVTLPGAGAAPATAASARHQREWLADRLEQAVSPVLAKRHLAAWEAIADRNGGTRLTGTPGAVESGDYLVEQLQAAGYRVTRQPVPYTDQIVDVERAEQLTPANREITALLARYSPSTAAGGFTAPVVTPASGPSDAGPGCEPQDYDGLTVAGAIVVLPRGSCGWTAQQRVAASLGARAMLFWVVTARPANIYRVQVINQADVTIPVATVTQQQGEQLAADAAAGTAGTVGTATMHLELRGHLVSGTTENVIAETAGGRADRVVMTGAHLDSVREGPGINDNATSAAALLDTAIALAPYQHQITNRVRFAWWGAEELIVVGSRYYVGQLSAQQRRSIVLYLNYELLASPNFARFIMDGDDSDHPGFGSGPAPAGSGAVEQTLTGYFAARGIPSETQDIAGIGSDHEPFMAAGIPVGGMNGGTYGTKTAEQAVRYGGVAGDMYDPCYHQSCDRVGNLSDQAFAENIRGVAWVLGRFAVDVSDVRPSA